MLKQAKGYLGLVLHAHIPYVLAHGRWPHGMDWLSEATAECYLPLLDCLERLVAEGVSPKITISFTPVLCEQLADPAFAEEFRAYLAERVRAAEEAADRRTRVARNPWGGAGNAARKSQPPA